MFPRKCKRTGCSEQREGDCKTWTRCDYFVPAPTTLPKTETVKKACASTKLEEAEQKALYAWCQDMGIVMVHIPNEARRTARVGASLKVQGMQPGFPDNFFPYAKQGYNGLFIELKREDKRLSKVSANQKFWIEKLQSEGYRAEICYGAQEAKDVVINYMTGLLGDNQ